MSENQSNLPEINKDVTLDNLDTKKMIPTPSVQFSQTPVFHKDLNPNLPIIEV